MSNLGKYQDIIENAHQEGGPDLWLDRIKNTAYNEGVSDTKKMIYPLAGIFISLGIGIGIAGKFAYDKINRLISEKREKKLLNMQETEQAEKLLKQELNSVFDKSEKDAESENQ